MTKADFTVTRIPMIAADFGKEFFDNGYNRQVLYTVSTGGHIIAQTTSTKWNDNLFALVIIGFRCIDGVQVEPREEIVYQVKFSVNGNKKTGPGARVIALQASI